MNLQEWAKSDTFETAWERGGFAGIGVRAELPEKGEVVIGAPFPEPGYTRRAIQAPNGEVITDDGSDKFATAWHWCAVELPAGTKYGHVWNPDPTGLDDLAIQFVDDPNAPHRTRHAAKTFQEWAATAQLKGDESDFEKRQAWKEGKAKMPPKAEREAAKAARAQLRKPKG